MKSRSDVKITADGIRSECFSNIQATNAFQADFEVPALEALSLIISFFGPVQFSGLASAV